jgi:poly(A) polymerase
MFKFYEVGGKVRDELLGLKSKDVDYVAVPNDKILADGYTAERMFEILELQLNLHKFEIFLVTKNCYTIRAKFPKGHKYEGVADFVMARKEIGYIPGTRTPIIVPGTLYDDLERRDFTVNAMARDKDGSIIDPFNGQEDLKNKILKTPLDCNITFNDDPLRII